MCARQPAGNDTAIPYLQGVCGIFMKSYLNLWRYFKRGCLLAIKQVSKNVCRRRGGREGQHERKEVVRNFDLNP